MCRRLIGKVFFWDPANDSWRGAPGPIPEITDEPASQPQTTEEIVACLKRIHKSIGRWTKQSGKRGYLEFAGRFIV